MQSYPNLLVVASVDDARVPFHQVAKYVAAVQTNNTSPDPLGISLCARSVWSSCLFLRLLTLFRHTVLLNVVDGGHLQEGGRYGAIDARALDYAFLMHSIDARALHK